MENATRESQFFNLLTSAKQRGTLPDHLAEALDEIINGTYEMQKHPIQPVTFDYGASNDPTLTSITGLMHEEDAAIIMELVKMATMSGPDVGTRVPIFEVLYRALGWQKPSTSSDTIRRILSSSDLRNLTSDLNLGYKAFIGLLEKAHKRGLYALRTEKNRRSNKVFDDEEDDDEDEEPAAKIPRKTPKVRDCL